MMSVSLTKSVLVDAGAAGELLAVSYGSVAVGIVCTQWCSHSYRLQCGRCHSYSFTSSMGGHPPGKLEAFDFGSWSIICCFSLCFSISWTLVWSETLLKMRSQSSTSFYASANAAALSPISVFCPATVSSTLFNCIGAAIFFTL